MFISLSIAAILPMIEAYRVMFTNTVSAMLAWGAFGYVESHPPLLSERSYCNLTCFTFRRLLWFMISYGHRLRAVVDVGFSTADYDYIRMD